MNQPIRKSEVLGLSFPYDWSNSAIPDEALILNVLERGIFEDVCRICAHYGFERVEASFADLPVDLAHNPALIRIMTNIKKGFAHAEARHTA